MAFKINISTKDGKTYKLEAEAPALKGKNLGDVIKGQDISPDLAGYELQITGTSDKSGLTAMENVQGIGLKKALLGYGKGMHKRPKGDKKVNKSPPGLRLRKTVRGKVISSAISQINTKVLKQGSKKLSEIFPEQNKAPEKEAEPEAKPAEEGKAEENTAEERPAEKKEEKPKGPAEEKQEQPPQDAKPESEPKETPPTEGNPEEEPKESSKAIEEGTHPDEEPKQ